MTPRTIYLLSDGTGNSAASSHRSNVWRFYQALHLGDGSHQLAFYDDGVGTSNFPLARAAGGAFGIGLAGNVQELYASLCLHYKPGDRIVMVGFSRGAFTVRLVAAMVCKLGIVPLADKDDMAAAATHDPEAWHRLPPDRRGRAVRIAKEAWRTYRFRSSWRAEDRAPNTLPHGPLFSLAYRHHTQARFQARYLGGAAEAYCSPRIQFLGVWDTVAAYGLPIDELAVVVNNLITPLRFNDHDINPRVQCARQALALDEARQTFKPLIWNECASHGNADVKQVWFAGVHADLGGGYPDDALANQALQWMIEEYKHAATRQGFEAGFKAENEAQIRGMARFDGPLHNSRRGLAALYRYKPRNIHMLCNQGVTDSLDEVEVRAPAAVIHKSAISRLLANHDEYAPTALAKPWGRSATRQLPIHIDARAASADDAAAVSLNIGHLFALHTKARQRLHENVLLSQANHNVCVIALTVFLAYLAGVWWPWRTCPNDINTHQNLALFISLFVFLGTWVYSKRLRTRRRSLADLGLARVRTEGTRVVAAAEQGEFKQSIVERLAMQLLGWQLAAAQYKLLVKYVLPVVLLVGLAWLTVAVLAPVVTTSVC
ncbi:MAG: DUF2235 domain-containing protein [Pseudomonadota bacterium]